MRQKAMVKFLQCTPGTPCWNTCTKSVIAGSLPKSFNSCKVSFRKGGPVLSEICRTQVNMIFFSPRLLRLESEHTVTIGLQERQSGFRLPGKCGGVVVDISESGACLILSQVLLEGKHLFFSTLDSDSYHLVLGVVNPHSVDESFVISARSVWMDSCRYKKQPAFKVGICFLNRQKKLFRMFKGAFSN